MLARIVLALCVAFVVYVACLLLGELLPLLGFPIASVIGAFLVKWALAFALVAGLWFFFSGTTWASIRGRF